MFDYSLLSNDKIPKIEPRHMRAAEAVAELARDPMWPGHIGGPSTVSATVSSSIPDILPYEDTDPSSSQFFTNNINCDLDIFSDNATTGPSNLQETGKYSAVLHSLCYIRYKL